MTPAPNSPREATRRVSDEELAEILAELKLGYIPLASDHFNVLRDLRDSRAREADLTRRLAEANEKLVAAWDYAHNTQAQLDTTNDRLAEAERERDEAWCAGRDASRKDVKWLIAHWEEGCGKGRELEALDVVLARLGALNPPKPEGGRG